MCCNVSVSSSGLAWMRKFIYTNTETDDHKNKKSIWSYTFLLLFFNLDREKSCKGREWNQANNERIFVLLTWINFKVLFSFFLRWADEAFKDADWRQERTWPLTNLFSMKNESPDSSHRPFYYVSFKSNQSE